MNRYTHRFTATCPVNGRDVAYTLVIESAGMIKVEDIIAACNVGEALHEPLADTLLARLGGRQVMRAYHHGVEIVTVRE